MGRTWKGNSVYNATVKASILTQQFKNGRANLQQVDDVGCTAWHGLAKRMFSSEIISGFPNAERDFHPKLAALLVKQFITVGKMKLKLRAA
jgi:hypothetical protein